MVFPLWWDKLLPLSHILTHSFYIEGTPPFINPPTRGSERHPWWRVPGKLLFSPTLGRSAMWKDWPSQTYKHHWSKFMVPQREGELCMQWGWPLSPRSIEPPLTANSDNRTIKRSPVRGRCIGIRKAYDLHEIWEMFFQGACYKLQTLGLSGEKDYGQCIKQIPRKRFLV